MLASNASKSAFGIFANASSVGAKTVYGPLPFKVFTKSAVLSATTNVLKLPAATAVSTISLAAKAVRDEIAKIDPHFDFHNWTED